MSQHDYRPTMAQLRAYVTIAELKNFSQSAAKLRISQPSLSQALSALEKGIGLQLLERSTRKVILTPAGAALLPYARQTLDATADFLAKAQGVAESPTGSFTLGVIPTVAPYILPHLLRLVGERLPSISLNVIEDKTVHLVQSLREGAIDAALLALPLHESALTSIPLYTEEFYLVVPENHELAGKKDVDPAILNDIELLLLDDGHCLRDQVLDLCRRVAKSRGPLGSSAESSTSTAADSAGVTGAGDDATAPASSDGSADTGTAQQHTGAAGLDASAATGTGDATSYTTDASATTSDTPADAHSGTHNGASTSEHRGPTKGLGPLRTTSTLTRLASLTTVVQCVAGGLGSTLVPASAIPVESSRPNVAVASFDQSISPTVRDIGLVHRASATKMRGDQFATMGDIIAEAYRLATESLA